MKWLEVDDCASESHFFFSWKKKMKYWMHNAKYADADHGEIFPPPKLDINNNIL